jgi:hypothetical protein
MKLSIRLFIGIVLIINAELSFASKLFEVKVVDKDYILVYFKDGIVVFNENVNLPGAYTNSTYSKDINKTVWYGSALNTTEAVNTTNWKIVSSDDANYGATGLNPISCYRKSKLGGMAQLDWVNNDWTYDKPIEHSIYLKLPQSLQPGKTYTIQVDNKTNSDITSTDITFDIFNNVSEAVHVNLVGYLSDASIKAADLYIWMGDGGARDYSTFVGKKVYIYDVNAQTSQEVGSVSFWKSNSAANTEANGFNLIASNVWKADFTGFSTPGTYRLAIEDVGCSQDFTISNDAYFQPFQVSTRGYFYMRECQDSVKMRPVPRRPLFLSGSTYSIFLTTMNPYDPKWSTFESGDPWDNAGNGSGVSYWDQYVKTGRPKNLKVRGGHGDAFDNDRHLGHISSIYDMLLPFVLTDGAITDDNLGIAESGNGIPDIIDEARNEVDFWLNLRDGKGYGHGLTNANGKNYLYQAGTTAVAAWANAANCSMLSYCLQLAGKDSLMKIYRDSAIVAYNYAGSLADQQLDKSQNIGDVDIRGRDLKMMAAAYLYNITGETGYENVVNTESLAKSTTSTITGWYWNGSTSVSVDQMWGTAAYLKTKRPVHYSALYSNMKASIINEAKTQEANNINNRPSRRATDNNTGWWKTTQNVQRTLIAHAVTNNATEKAFFENAIVLEADWGLGRNPLNMIQMTTTTTSLESKRSVENMYTSGRNDGSPGVHPGQTPYMGTGKWSDGSQGDPTLMTALCYPSNFEANWPKAEAYFNTRYVYANAEFTPQQTMRGKMALYGYLYGLYKPVSPLIISTSDSTVCSQGKTTLGALTNVGTVNWYDAPTGGSLLGAGNSFLTPSIDTTTTYYAEAYLNDTLKSLKRTPVLAKVVSTAPVIKAAIKGDTVVCPGTQGVLYMLPTDTTIDSYVWTLPTGASPVKASSGNSISVNYTNTALSGNIRVKGRNVCGFGTDTSLTIKLNPLPVAAGLINGPTAVCKSSTETFKISALPGATSYIWTLPTGSTGTSSTDSISVSFGNNAASGNIKVKGVFVCGAGTERSLAITVNGIPATPIVSLNGGTLQSNAPSGNQWYYSDTVIAGATNAVYTPNVTGDYYVIVTINNCSSDTSNIVTFIPTEVKDIENRSGIKVYPNPTTGFIKISITQKLNSDYTIDLFDNAGSLLQHLNKNLSLNSVEVDLSKYPAGSYLLKISTIDRSYQTKVIHK